LFSQIAYMLTRGFTETCATWCSKIPIVNFFFFVFFNGVPSLDSIKDLLNNLGLLAALILSVAGGINGSVGYADLLAADQRFASANAFAPGSPQGEYGCFKGWPDGKSLSPAAPISALLGTQFNACIAQLAVVVLIVIFAYLSISTLQGPNGSPATDGMVKAWFYIARWILMFCCLVLMTGIFMFFMMLGTLTLTAFPDAWIAEACKEPNAHDPPRQIEWNGTPTFPEDSYSPYKNTQAWMYYFLAPVFAIAVGLLGLAAFYSVRTYDISQGITITGGGSGSASVTEPSPVEMQNPVGSTKVDKHGGGGALHRT